MSNIMTDTCRTSWMLARSLFFISLAWSMCIHKTVAQNLNDLLVLPPDQFAAYTAPTVETYDAEQRVAITLPLTDAIINANYSARAAGYYDSTRLASFASGNFLPSAIPVEGQPYFGTGGRANLQGSGSAIRLSAFAPASSNIRASAHVDLVLDTANFASAGESAAVGLGLGRVVALVNGFTIGATESAFADPSAVPETVDIAGPSARVTVFDAGITKGKGRLSYDFFSEGPEGFKVVGSVEQSITELSYTQTGESQFSHIPDFVVAPQYVAGKWVDKQFEEDWHVQFASVFRDLGFETPLATEQTEFGWGTSLSGAYRLAARPSRITRDRFLFSMTCGEGISHYLVDLNAALDTGDAAVNATGELEALPVFAWYCGYTHNWTDTLRSTVTYSRIDLDSILPRLPAISPYRSGDYVGVNLMRHIVVGEPSKPKKVFFGGEWLYGHKQTLDGAEGDAHRLMMVLALSN